MPDEVLTGGANRSCATCRRFTPPPDSHPEGICGLKPKDPKRTRPDSWCINWTDVVARAAEKPRDSPAATVRLEASGKLVGGPIVQRHEMGQVTIVWAGQRITGFPVVPEPFRQDTIAADQQ